MPRDSRPFSRCQNHTEGSSSPSSHYWRKGQQGCKCMRLLTTTPYAGPPSSACLAVACTPFGLRSRLHAVLCSHNYARTLMPCIYPSLPVRLTVPRKAQQSFDRGGGVNRSPECRDSDTPNFSGPAFPRLVRWCAISLRIVYSPLCLGGYSSL